MARLATCILLSDMAADMDIVVTISVHAMFSELSMHQGSAVCIDTLRMMPNVSST